MITGFGERFIRHYQVVDVLGSVDNSSSRLPSAIFASDKAEGAGSLVTLHCLASVGNGLDTIMLREFSSLGHFDFGLFGNSPH